MIIAPLKRKKKKRPNWFTRLFEKFSFLYFSNFVTLSALQKTDDLGLSKHILLTLNETRFRKKKQSALL